MSEFINKAKGIANEALGKAKVTIGQNNDNPGLIIEGAGQEAKGKAQKLTGLVEGALAEKP